jgi:hypothetical protein
MSGEQKPFDKWEKSMFRTEELHLSVLIFRLFFSLDFFLLHEKQIEEDLEELFV